MSKGYDFSKVFPEFLPKIKAIANSYRAGEFTEDLVQEGLTALYIASLVFDESRNVPFENFALTCIKNAMISALRKNNKLNSVNFCDFTDSSHIISTAPGPDEMTLMTEDFNNLKTIIKENLSDFELKVLNCYLNRESYSQIAKALKKGEKSVDNALTRIKNKLSKLL